MELSRNLLNSFLSTPIFKTLKAISSSVSLKPDLLVFCIADLIAFPAVNERKQESGEEENTEGPEYYDRWGCEL